MSFARLRALVVLGVLFVSATAVLTFAIVTDGQDDAHAATSCGSGDVAANLHMPDDNSTIKLHVFNATSSPGLAGQVASEFKSQRFQVVKEETAPPPVKEVVAELRYGPKMVGAAQVVRAYFLNKAKMTFDINRDDDVIDVYIGTKFLELASFTDQRQSLGQAGKPQLPPGTCDANAS